MPIDNLTGSGNTGIANDSQVRVGPPELNLGAPPPMPGDIERVLGAGERNIGQPLIIGYLLFAQNHLIRLVVFIAWAQVWVRE